MKKTLFLIALAVLYYSCQRKNKQELLPLDKLKAGNERFVKHYPIHPDETLQRIQELEKGQHPFAVIVSCSDSRVPPELIFDRGLGDLFSIRTAGNIIGDYELGSIEYAVEHLHCNLVIVLGHQNCGAVQAFLESNGKRHNDHIQSIIDYIAAEKEIKSITDRLKNNLCLAIKVNTQHGVDLLKNSKVVLKPLVDSRQLEIVGGYYNLGSGKVIFYE